MLGSVSRLAQLGSITRSDMACHTGSSTMDFAVCLCWLWLTWISWRTWKICLSCTECSRVRITVSNVAGEQVRMWPSLSRSRHISNGPIIFSCKNVLQKHQTIGKKSAPEDAIVSWYALRRRAWEFCNKANRSAGISH